MTIFYRMLRPELLQAWRGENCEALSPDAFTRWGGTTAESKHKSQVVTEATQYLVNRVIPGYARALDSTNPMEQTFYEPVSQFVHAEGINVRHMGLLRSLLTQNMPARLTLLVEIVARAAKSVLREWLRTPVRDNQPSQSDPANPSAAPTGNVHPIGGASVASSVLGSLGQPESDLFYHLNHSTHYARLKIVRFFNLISGANPAFETFWQSVLLPAVVQRFGERALAEQERANLFVTVMSAQAIFRILRHLLHMTNIRLTERCHADIERENQNGAHFLFTVDDVFDTEARVKHLGTFEVIKGTLLAQQAGIAEISVTSATRLHALAGVILDDVLSVDALNTPAVVAKCVNDSILMQSRGEFESADTVFLLTVEAWGRQPSHRLISEALFTALMEMWQQRVHHHDASTVFYVCGAASDATLSRALDLYAALRLTGLDEAINTATQLRMVAWQTVYHALRFTLTQLSQQEPSSMEIPPESAFLSLMKASRAERRHALGSRLMVRAFRHLPHRLEPSPFALRLMHELFQDVCQEPVSQEQVDNLLFPAVRIGNSTAVRYLLSMGANPALADSFGDTPLILAARFGHQSLILDLAAPGVDVNAVNRQKESAIVTAVRYERIAVLEALLQTAARREEALIMAAYYGKEECAQLILSTGVQVDMAFEGYNALRHAIEQDRNGVVRLLLRSKASPNIRYSTEDTPLICAIRVNNVEAVELLLQHGADVHAPGGEHERTPLLHAVALNNAHAVRLLLQNKANVHSRDSSGCTALMLAAEQGFSECVRLLLSYGADSNALSAQGWTALMFAAKNGNADVVNLLLEARAQTDPADSPCPSPLLLAVSQGRYDAVALLLERRANTEAKAEKGLTPVMIAARQGYTNILLLLLNNYANPNARDDSGWTPLMHAAATLRADCVEVLLRARARTDVTNNEGRTAVEIALSKKGNEDVVALLESSLTAAQSAEFAMGLH